MTLLNVLAVALAFLAAAVAAASFASLVEGDVAAPAYRRGVGR